MRTLIVLALLSLLIPAASASAQAPSAAPAARGSVPDSRLTTLPEPTSVEVSEANEVRRICETSNEKDYFDCDCVSINYLQQRMFHKATSQSFDVFSMKDKAKKACPNTVAIAGQGYQSCLSWAPRLRPDYQAFCECYGNAYADAFAKNPAVTIQESKAVMSTALQKCDVGAPITARIQRNARIKEMERAGIYDEMYPGAADRSKPRGPQPGDPLPSQLAPWQKMQRTLFDTDTARDTPQP